MEKKDALALISRYIDHTASEAERQWVEQHFLEYLKKGGQLPDSSLTEKASQEIWAHLDTYISGPAGRPKRRRLWPRLAIAATTILAVSASLFFALDALKEDDAGVLIVNNRDLPPGKNTATLTTDDGRSLTLSDKQSGISILDGRLTYNDGSAVATAGTPKAPASMFTASTPRGGTYQLTLSDGSRVWLNSGSSLRFPAEFSGKQRKVELKGEAYFEVSKAKQKQPESFVVLTNRQQVEVLGTHFNVSNYHDEPLAKTTLIEGSVRITALQASPSGQPASVVLQPSQQAVLQHHTIEIKRGAADEAVAWKNGYFDFNEESLESIMSRIARWYDLNVVYEEPRLKTQRFTGIVSRGENVSEVLKKLALSKVVRFRVEGRQVIVTD